MIYLSSDDCEIILHFCLFLLHFLLEHVNVLFLIAEEEDYIIGKDIGMFGHHITQL